MAKKTEKVHYLYEGVMQDVKVIYRKHRKRRGRSLEVSVVGRSRCPQGRSIDSRAPRFRPQPQQPQRLASSGNDGYELYGGGSDPYLRKALGNRGVLQGLQELPALSEGLPRTLVRCHDGTCFHRIHAVHVSGGGTARIQR